MLCLVLKNSLTIKYFFLGSVIFRKDMFLLSIVYYFSNMILYTALNMILNKVLNMFSTWFEHEFELGFEHELKSEQKSYFCKAIH